MLSAITTGAPEIPLWLWLLSTLGIGMVIAFIATFPSWRAFLTKRTMHEKRIEAACDAVLGRDPDPNVGRLERIPGLVDVVPNMQAAIGHRNGKSIMEHIADIETHLGMGAHQ